MPKEKYNEFNSPNTLAIISPYSKKGENPRGFSIIRYTKLLVNSFPEDQKVVIFCERDGINKTYLAAPNVLIVPTYKINSVVFFSDLIKKLLAFDAIENILVQFEFSIFGGKIVIPQFLALVLALKLTGKSVKISFHQVVDDINTLFGHLAIKKNGIKARVLNFLLKLFYAVCGALADKVFVHDVILAEKISRFVDNGKIKIIPHGINTEDKIGKKLVVSSKKYFRVEKGTKLVGIFGYCSWYKGTDWLIENFAKFARENPGKKVRLLVAGGESPTLKGTLAYKKYHKKLKKVIKEANGNIIYTGYVPDEDVKKVFAAVDLFVFPYRTKMSASGAFSLCLGYKKPYIVSKAFSENIERSEAWGRMFSLNYESFSNALTNAIKLNKASSPSIQWRSWGNVANLYLRECLPGYFYLPKLEYAKAY